MSVKEVIPLVFVDIDEVGNIADWAVNVLGCKESWRAPGDDGRFEHVELRWGECKVSINRIDDRSKEIGPASIGLRIDDKAEVEAIYASAQAAGANIKQPLAESRISYSFTVADPAGNDWWVHAENGFLDELRAG